jgi:cold shock CspA family protein
MANKGTVKSMGREFGFINCAETHAVYGRDVFIQKLNISEALWNSLQTGQGVTFDVTLDAKAQPQAMNVTITSQGDPSAKKGGKDKGWGKGKKGWEASDPYAGYGDAWGGDGGYGGKGGGYPPPEAVGLPPQSQMVSLQGQAGYFVPMSVLSPMAPYGAAPGGGGKKRPADEMDGGKGGKGGKGWGDSKFPRPAVPNPGLDPEQQTFSGVMKGRLNMQTGYGFIQSDEVGMMYPGKDVFVHSKMCPWVESMTLEKDTKVQFQYVEKDGAPQCVRIVVLEGTTAGASAFTSFSAPMGGSGPTLAAPF